MVGGDFLTCFSAGGIGIGKPCLPEVCGLLSDFFYDKLFPSSKAISASGEVRKGIASSPARNCSSSEKSWLSEEDAHFARIKSHSQQPSTDPSSDVVLRDTQRAWTLQMCCSVSGLTHPVK